MVTKRKKKLGRPSEVPGDVKRHPINMRTTQALRKKLDKSAANSGRSLAQEIEYRLTRSFHSEDALSVAGIDPRTSKFIRAILDAKLLIEERQKKSSWEDFDTWLLFKGAVNALFGYEAPKESKAYLKRVAAWKSAQKKSSETTLKDEQTKTKKTNLPLEGVTPKHPDVHPLDEANYMGFDLINDLLRMHEDPRLFRTAHRDPATGAIRYIDDSTTT